MDVTQLYKYCDALDVSFLGFCKQLEGDFRKVSRKK